MLATAVKTPPSGEEWLHECKMDGFRCQIHIHDGQVSLYSRTGNDFTRRFSALRPVLAEIPARQAIIDAELIACDGDGNPDFRALMAYGSGSAVPLALWCFDLLSLDGTRLMPLRLDERKERLAELVAAADHERLQFSGGFSDAAQLMAACERMGMEGIVSKRRASAYRPGPSREWQKAKTASWRAANAARFELMRGP